MNHLTISGCQSWYSLLPSFAGLLALVAADGFHRAGRAGHGRSLHSRAGPHRHGRQQSRGGRARHNRVQFRRGRQEEAEAAAGYDAPAADAYGAPDYEASGAEESYAAPATYDDYDYEASGAEETYGAPAPVYEAADAAADAYGAPPADEYGAPAEESYDAPDGSGSGSGDYEYDDGSAAPEESYGAPAEETYGRLLLLNSGLYFTKFAGPGAPAEADDAYGAPPTYEEEEAARRGRGRFNGRRPAARRPAARRPAARRPAARRPAANRRPAAAKAPRAGRQFRQKANKRPAQRQRANKRPAQRQNRRQRPAQRQNQQPRRGRGLIAIPIPHRGPRRNAVAFRQPTHGK